MARWRRTDGTQRQPELHHHCTSSRLHRYTYTRHPCASHGLSRSRRKGDNSLGLTRYDSVLLGTAVGSPYGLQIEGGIASIGFMIQFQIVVGHLSTQRHPLTSQDWEGTVSVLSGQRASRLTFYSAHMSNGADKVFACGIHRGRKHIRQQRT